MSRIAAAPARMTPERISALIRELDLLRPSEVDSLTAFERATYRRAIETAPIRPKHAQALRLALA